MHYMSLKRRKWGQSLLSLKTGKESRVLGEKKKKSAGASACWEKEKVLVLHTPHWGKKEEGGDSVATKGWRRYGRSLDA